MHTVVETPGYLRDAESIFTAQERENVVALVAGHPECGEVMQGTGGVRKVRIGRGGRGKSGGARVVYIHHDAEHPVFLLAAFAKNEKANLSKAERNEMAKVVNCCSQQRRLGGERKGFRQDDAWTERGAGLRGG